MAIAKMMPWLLRTLAGIGPVTMNVCVLVSDVVW
jgi:hypothetical protein